ncbi:MULTISPECIES: zinc finger domain-containing protein [unclassified Rhodococcus (in: high G+C Gram-positive bacteria)]|uniref:zinc finger domain-containing protein n=1 Tax=unclassified Rhodococcus (in: high G+C Gram-positive bacteria) TaxID=192944 RepID=UPI001140453B|nr:MULTISPECIES: hypothetical protein [unclassified Rhodococcus (in: high G+C Gram-positive bacteria)]
MTPMRNPSFDQMQTRQLALTVACRYCHAPAGEPCTVPGRTPAEPRRPLENFPAHHCRTNHATRLRRLQQADQQRNETP